MKCKNCGGEIRLEEMYCPYCGSPNEEARMHARDMQHYRKAFQKTQQDVVERAGRQTRLAVRVAAAALLAVAIGVNIFLQANSYSLIRMRERSRIQKNIPQHTARLEEYLEKEDYPGFESYYYNAGLSWEDEAFEEYYPIHRLASSYRYAVDQLMRLVNPSRYSDSDRTGKYVSDYIQDFYENLDPERYSYLEEYNTPKVQQHFANMTDAMDALCVAYLGMTPEEAASMRTLSRSGRVILIERGLEQYSAADPEEMGGEP